MHISPCVVSVTAAAAADFPGLPKPSTVANLSQHTSADSQSRFVSELQDEDRSEADGGVVSSGGRGQDQEAGHQVPARLQRPERSGECRVS